MLTNPVSPVHAGAQVVRSAERTPTGTQNGQRLDPLVMMTVLYIKDEWFGLNNTKQLLILRCFGYQVSHSAPAVLFPPDGYGSFKLGMQGTYLHRPHGCPFSMKSDDAENLFRVG